MKSRPMIDVTASLAIGGRVVTFSGSPYTVLNASLKGDL
jgi:hypothetical protein